MKTLELNSVGLVELNSTEMRETEGGILAAVLAVIEICAAAYGAGYAVGYFASH